ncbi:hypothetical protein OGAPHI_005457 [Ogataea philodendri]|uniref:choline-phosphate cytidylyltransferase n=1 Tax=Ogataea philodendri TaxID=1378263 RepID=A0A9P8T1J6_9ASCO|nr:uncharacterized protein OGAPHI_005457 [Ogataea philodendri]KAH3662209.1 hypothetical protein OGAPHI_005457 [Ogataea philodendri]
MEPKQESASPDPFNGNNVLARTLSMNSLIKTDSFTKLFKKSNKRARSEDSEQEDAEDAQEIQVVKKPKTRSTKEEEAFRKREKEYDELLSPEYRKYRPKGFKLNPPPEDRPIRIYADGVFDLFHLGHMRQLEQCKKAFPSVTLVVGIPNDVETHKRKGLTVLSDKQRYETLRHCKWVDEVIEDAPWILTIDFLRKHKIDFCAHDDLPYEAQGIDDIYKPMKQAGMFLATQRTEGISTSDIITKIIRDYDKYLMRNFARGATRKELNVSWLKKNELDLKKQINDFRSYWKKTNDSLNNASRDLYTEVREFLKNRKNENSPADSPADSFASRYNANGLESSSSRRSLIDNFKDWVGMDSHSEFESEEEDKPVVTKRGRRSKKPK